MASTPASTLSLCVLITFSLPLAIFANIDNSRLDNQIPDRICDLVKDGVLFNSPGIVDNLATCTAICDASTQCQAASLLPNKRCYHFTTNCLNMVETKGAVTVIPQGSFEWTLVGYGKSCRGKSLSSSGKQQNVAACHNSCKSASNCRSFTFLPDKTCNHFTKCDSTDYSAKAMSYVQLAQQHQCDDSNRGGETFLKFSSSKVLDLAACKKSCMDEPTCQSVTYWYAKNYCSHFSTPCTNRRRGAKAIALRVKKYTTTTSTTTPTFDAKHGVVCDVSQAEIWLSYHKVSDYAACVKSCVDSPKCKSITYYHDWRGCSHFKTSCKKTKSEPHTISKNVKPEFLNGKECDVSQGERFLSSKTVNDLKACKKSCTDATECQSITYYSHYMHHGCKHFATRCEKTKTVEYTHTERLKDFTTTTTSTNPCLNNNGGCDSKRACTNNAGSAKCGDCPAGYTNDGAKGCKDVDECLNNNGGCHGSRKCTNKVGSMSCGDCSTGYTNDGEKGCKDVNECLKNNGGCDRRHLCINVPGSVTCAYCPDGYENDGSNGCQEVAAGTTAAAGTTTAAADSRAPKKWYDCDYKGFRSCVDDSICKSDGGNTKCAESTMAPKCNAKAIFCGTKPTTAAAGTTTAAAGTTTAAAGNICKGKGTNPCEIDNGGCHSKRACTNNAGSAKCGDCPAGYTNDGAKGCKAISGTPNVVCDVSKREVWVTEPKVADYAACLKSCTDSPKCKSITFYPHGGCSHFSTMCKNTKYEKGALAKNLKGEALNNEECDVSKGEKWLSKTQVSSLAACRKSCSDEKGCNSFTYYNHGSCSHFSTCCEKTKFADNGHTEHLTT